MIMESIPVPATTSSGLALVAGQFEAPPFVVPNAKGDTFKIEQVVSRSPERTEKLVWWFGPDDDRHPHSHPWAFDSTILAGGYTSIAYWLEDIHDAGTGDYGTGPEYASSPLVSQVVRCEERIVRAGDVVHYPLHEYHLVRDVLPGTRTRMVCGPARPGNQWDYLDPATGRVYPYQEQPDTTFVERMRKLNPWRR